MLSKMRDHQRSFLIYLLFGIIIVVFAVYFGPGSKGLEGGTPWAAKIDGKLISQGEFQFSYSRIYERYKSQMPTFNQEIAKKLKLKNQVMQNIIRNRLLALEAKKMGVRIPEEILIKAIKEMPFFKQGDNFDFALYQKIVNYYFQTSLSNFELQFKRDLIAQQFSNSLMRLVHVSNSEVEEAYKNDQEKINLQFIKFAPDQFPPRKNIEAEEIAALKKDEPQKLKDYYNNHKSKYKTPKQVRARHILIKVPKDAPPEERLNAQAKIEQISLEAPKENFADLAIKYSQDTTTKDKGGDLGFFSRGKMVKPFEMAAFALKEGEVSKPVESIFGYHIIKCEEIKKPTSKTFEEVEEEIARQLINDEHQKKAAKKEAENYLAQFKAKTPFEQLIPKPSVEIKEDGESKDDTVSDAQGEEKRVEKPNSYGLIIEETGDFSPGQEYVFNIGMADEVSKAAIHLTKEKPAPKKIFEVNEKFFLISLKERKEADMEKFKDEKEKTRKELLEKKKQQVVDAWVKEKRAEKDIVINPLILSYDK